jgi:hypothetical protein
MMKLKFFTLILIFLTLQGCVESGANDFRIASKRFLNCEIHPPWPVELVGEIDDHGATFNVVESDPWKGRSVYFSTTNTTEWEASESIRVVSKIVDEYEPYEIRFLNHKTSYGNTRIDKDIVIIRKGSYELILPGTYSQDWSALIHQCHG